LVFSLPRWFSVYFLQLLQQPQPPPQEEQLLPQEQEDFPLFLSRIILATTKPTRTHTTSKTTMVPIFSASHANI
jgi:hypothetical protein